MNFLISNDDGYFAPGIAALAETLSRFGSVTVVAPDCALADAAATAIGNRVRTATDIEPALDFGLAIAGVRGVAIILGNRMGLRGELELVPLQQKRVEF